eukprot:m.56460 g.56460  ORF g.56460 m.56460 type:complete len:549 (+) comp16970_c0_seq1:109-1755(+)
MSDWVVGVEGMDLDALAEERGGFSKAEVARLHSRGVTTDTFINKTVWTTEEARQVAGPDASDFRVQHIQDALQGLRWIQRPQRSVDSRSGGRAHRVEGTVAGGQGDVRGLWCTSTGDELDVIFKDGTVAFPVSGDAGLKTGRHEMVVFDRRTGKGGALRAPVVVVVHAEDDGAHGPLQQWIDWLVKMEATNFKLNQSSLTAVVHLDGGEAVDIQLPETPPSEVNALISVTCGQRKGFLLVGDLDKYSQIADLVQAVKARRIDNVAPLVTLHKRLSEARVLTLPAAFGGGLPSGVVGSLLAQPLLYWDQLREKNGKIRCVVDCGILISVAVTAEAFARHFGGTTGGSFSGVTSTAIVAAVNEVVKAKDVMGMGSDAAALTAASVAASVQPPGSWASWGIYQSTILLCGLAVSRMMHGPALTGTRAAALAVVYPVSWLLAFGVDRALGAVLPTAWGAKLLFVPSVLASYVGLTAGQYIVRTFLAPGVAQDEEGAELARFLGVQSLHSSDVQRRSQAYKLHLRPEQLAAAGVTYENHWTGAVRPAAAATDV